MNAPSTQRPFPRFALLLVVLLTIAVYARSVVFDFIWDDFSLVLLNPWLTSWAYAPRFFVGHMWSMSSISNIPFHYRPLYQLWMLLLSQTVGTVSTWWHLVSVLLHGIVTWMVFQLTRELTQDDWAALFSALIFGLFPVHVESVAWISASPDLLAGIALLASMLHHIRWMQQGRRPSDRWISLAWFVCAVFVKETTLAFPAVVIVGSMEWGSEQTWPQRFRATISSSWPFVAVCAFFMLVRSLALHAQKGFVPRAADLSQLKHIPLVYLSYFKMMLLTWRPTFFYDQDRYLHWHPTDALWVAGFCITLFTLLRAAQRSLVFRIGTAWWLFMIAVPVMAVVMLRSEYWVQDRSLYLASIGFSMIAGTWFAKRCTGLDRDRKPHIVVFVLLASLFGTAICLNLGRFESEETLFADAYQHSPYNMRSRYLHARTLMIQHRTSEADAINLETLRLDPHAWEAMEMLAISASDKGDHTKAMLLLDQARQYAPPQFQSILAKESDSVRSK